MKSRATVAFAAVQRLSIIAIDGFTMAALLDRLVSRTKLGVLVRAGASGTTMHGDASG